MENEPKAEKMRQHRRRYWQRFKEASKKRLYGTLSHDEWQEISAHARKNGRSVWGQVWAESCAYRRQQYLPPCDIEQQIQQLYAGLRAIATNLQEIHDSAGVLAALRKPALVSENLARLEQAVAEFVDRPWRIPDATGTEAGSDDH